MSRAISWVVWAFCCVLVLIGASTSTLFDLSDPADLPFGLAFAVLGVGAVSAGMVLIRRVPGNAVGPLLLTIGVGTGLQLTAGAYAEASQLRPSDPYPADVWAAWLSSWLSVPTFFGATILLLLLFPNGRLVSPRWRVAAWFAMSGVGLATVAAALAQRRIWPGFDNPAALDNGAVNDLVLMLERVTDLLALPVMLVAAASLVVRVRRSRGTERQQLKMFSYVAVLVGVGMGSTILARGLAADLAFLVGLTALASMPVVIAVSVLRHGLYGIDVVIKRTLVYAPLAGALVLTYLAMVLTMQALLPIAAENDLVVAVSTLAVAALFRPLRNRIQESVDRRFYRSRYDATHTLETFGARLREDVDLDSLGGDLREVVHRTMAPATVTLWLRPTEETR